MYRSSFGFIRNDAACRAGQGKGRGQGPWRWMEMTVGKKKKTRRTLKVKKKEGASRKKGKEGGMDLDSENFEKSRKNRTGPRTVSRVEWNGVCSGGKGGVARGRSSNKN